MIFATCGDLYLSLPLCPQEMASELREAARPGGSVGEGPWHGPRGIGVNWLSLWFSCRISRSLVGGRRRWVSTSTAEYADLIRRAIPFVLGLDRHGFSAPSFRLGLFLGRYRVGMPYGGA